MRNDHSTSWNISTCYDRKSESTHTHCSVGLKLSILSKWFLKFSVISSRDQVGLDSSFRYLFMDMCILTIVRMTRAIFANLCGAWKQEHLLLKCQQGTWQDTWYTSKCMFTPTNRLDLLYFDINLAHDQSRAEPLKKHLTNIINMPENEYIRIWEIFFSLIHYVL